MTQWTSLLVGLAALLLLALPPVARAQEGSTGTSPTHARQSLRRTPIVDVFEATKDSVVNISSTQIVEVRTPFGVDHPFHELFDFPAPRTRKYTRTSVGSGFVLHPAGYIVTNAHVVAATAERKVIFDENRQYEAQVIAMDQERDLAVLKIDAPEPLKPLPLGTSSDLMVGETVVAIGNPLGYQHSITSGIISALDRTLEINQKIQFSGLIQTDASINPGNSGGPLLNILGELIGINTAIRADAQNIGFAIPVDELRKLLPELLDIERRYRFTTGLRVGPDARITQVAPGSLAEERGFKVGDRILSVGQQQVENEIDWHVALIGRKPGEHVKVRLQRDGKTGSGTLTLVEIPRPDGAKLLVQRFGVTAEPMSDRMARALGLPGLKGLLVTQVEAGSPAEQVKLARGDVIVGLGRYTPESLDDVGVLLEQVKPGQTVTITVLRVAGQAVHRLSAPITAR